MITDYEKVCDYCHEKVSVFESLTEYGKHYHESCYIHLTQKAIEGYKKKWVNKTLTAGDKADIVDKYNLVQKLMQERTEFKGFSLVEERVVERRMLTDKPDRRILYRDGTRGMDPVLDGEGNPVFVEDSSPSVIIRNAVVRPSVSRAKTNIKPKLLTIEDVPKLMESLP